jgi:hypothetical protein
VTALSSNRKGPRSVSAEPLSSLDLLAGSIDFYPTKNCKKLKQNPAILSISRQYGISLHHAAVIVELLQIGGRE